MLCFVYHCKYILLIYISRAYMSRIGWRLTWIGGKRCHDGNRCSLKKKKSIVTAFVPLLVLHGGFIEAKILKPLCQNRRRAVYGQGIFILLQKSRPYRESNADHTMYEPGIQPHGDSLMVHCVFKFLHLQKKKQIKSWMRCLRSF